MKTCNSTSKPTCNIRRKALKEKVSKRESAHPHARDGT
jgi:hypothetical protein